MNSVEIYAKQRSNWGLLIGSLIFLFCSIYLFFNVNQVNSPTTAKLISVVMFVPSLILVLFSIKKLRKKQLIVLIDEKGIVFHPSEKLNYIVWGNIAEIEELKLPRQRVINIKVIESEKYILSMNDMNTLPILDQLLSSGICSFKIEGRMIKKNMHKALFMFTVDSLIKLLLRIRI